MKVGDRVISKEGRKGILVFVGKSLNRIREENGREYWDYPDEISLDTKSSSEDKPLDMATALADLEPERLSPSSKIKELLADYGDIAPRPWTYYYPDWEGTDVNDGPEVDILRARQYGHITESVVRSVLEGILYCRLNHPPSLK